MKINRQLHLVVPIYGEEKVRLDTAGKPVMEDGQPVIDQPVVAYVHSTPLPMEVVDRYFMVLAQTYSAIFSRGLGMTGGPGIAARLLRHIAVQEKVWGDLPDGSLGVANGLMPEIRQLTNVLVAGGNGQGWQTVPFEVAIQRGVIDSEDARDTENAIVFFIAAHATLARSLRKPLLEATSALWGAQVSSLSFTEFTSSLTTSTATATSDTKGSSAAATEASTSRAGDPANAVVDGKASSVPI